MTAPGSVPQVTPQPEGPGSGPPGFLAAEPAPFPLSSSPAVVPPAVAQQPSGSTGETITCPECGELSLIVPGKRRSEDFCRRCDFPLFWARSAIVMPSGESTGASLRRLPGTVGRADTAALDCPHCGEPNSPAAVLCVRCGKDMHPIAPPPPVVLVAPPPPPEPEPEPEAEFPWWWVLVICLCLLLITVIVAIVTLT